MFFCSPTPPNRAPVPPEPEPAEEEEEQEEEEEEEEEEDTPPPPPMPFTVMAKFKTIVRSGSVLLLFCTRTTTCYPDRAATVPHFVPGLPHVVAHSRRPAAKDPISSELVIDSEVEVFERKEDAQGASKVRLEGGWAIEVTSTGVVMLEPARSAIRVPLFAARPLKCHGPTPGHSTAAVRERKSSLWDTEGGKGPEIRQQSNKTNKTKTRLGTCSAHS